MPSKLRERVLCQQEQHLLFSVRLLIQKLSLDTGLTLLWDCCHLPGRGLKTCVYDQLKRTWMSIAFCLHLMFSLGPLGTEVQALFSEGGKAWEEEKKCRIPRRVLPCHSCERKSKLYRIVHFVCRTYLESPFSLKPKSKACSDTPVVVYLEPCSTYQVCLWMGNLFFKYRQAGRCESRPVIFSRGIWICCKKRTFRKINFVLSERSERLGTNNKVFF